MAENKTLQEQFFENIKTGAKWGVPVTIQRSGSATGGLPLDSYSIFESKAKADIYASLKEAEVKAAGMVNNGYIGQLVAVWAADDTVDIYYIDADKTLKPVGTTPVGDNKSIEVAEDGTVSIFGFDELTEEKVGYLPRVKKVVDKEAEGETPEESHFEIEWAPVDAIVQGDGNTKTVVESGDGGRLVKVELNRDAATDTNTYVIDVNTYDKNELDEIINNLPYKWSEDNLPASNEVEVSYATSDNSAFKITGLDTSSITDPSNLVLPRTYYEESATNGVVTEGYIESEVFSGSDYTDLEYINIYVPSNIVSIGAGNFDAFSNLENIYYELDQDAWEQVCKPGYVPEHVTVHYNYEMREQITVQDALGEVEEKVATIEGDYKITLTSRADEQGDDHSAFKHYILSQGGKEIGHIDIPTDLVVQSGAVVTATEEDKAKDDTVIVGEVYIKLVIANQEAPLYIAAKDLVEYITVDETSKTIGLELGNDHVLKAEVKLHTATEGEAANAIVVKDDGLYVEVPTETLLVGTNAINVEPVIGETKKTEISLVIDETEGAGNVTLTQDTNGLKANIDLSDYKIKDANTDFFAVQDGVLTIANLADATVKGFVEEGEEEKTLFDLLNERTNVIEGIISNTLDITTLASQDATIQIELKTATKDTLGGVVSTDAEYDEEGKITNAEEVENAVHVDDNGKMTVNILNVDRLVQTVGTRLVLNGGNASLD